jgi:hypothetical protein
MVPTTSLSSQGSKGCLFVETNAFSTIQSNPATPCHDLMHLKEEHFSPEMVKFLVQDYAALPASQYLLKGPGCRYFHQRLILAQSTNVQGPYFAVMLTITRMDLGTIDG